MSPKAKEFLGQIYEMHGTWPEHPCANTDEGKELQRLGLLELVPPNPPYLAHGRLTQAGMRKARELPKED